MTPDPEPGSAPSRADDACRASAFARRAGRARARRRPATRPRSHRGPRSRERRGREPGRLEDARPRWVPRGAAVHPRVGRRGRGRGGRRGCHSVRARRAGLRHAALPAGGRVLRGVRHVAVAPARVDAGSSCRRRGRGAPARRADGVAGARRDRGHPARSAGARARGGRRRRASRGADREGARRLRDRDGSCGETPLPRRARRRRGDRLHERGRRRARPRGRRRPRPRRRRLEPRGAARAPRRRDLRRRAVELGCRGPARGGGGPSSHHGHPRRARPRRPRGAGPPRVRGSAPRRDRRHLPARARRRAPTSSGRRAARRARSCSRSTERYRRSTDPARAYAARATRERRGGRDGTHGLRPRRVRRRLVLGAGHGTPRSGGSHRRDARPPGLGRRRDARRGRDARGVRRARARSARVAPRACGPRRAQHGRRHRDPGRGGLARSRRGARVRVRLHAVERPEPARPDPPPRGRRGPDPGEHRHRGRPAGRVPLAGGDRGRDLQRLHERADAVGDRTEASTGGRAVRDPGRRGRGGSRLDPPLLRAHDARSLDPTGAAAADDRGASVREGRGARGGPRAVPLGHGRAVAALLDIVGSTPVAVGASV